MDSTTRFSTQRVGALPVVVAYLEKMQLADMIDTHVPWEGEVALGMLIEIMVCNRLLNPKAQYKIGEWAERAGVCDYYNVTPEQLNDDRLVYAADTKFDSPENLLTNKAAGGQFLCGGVFQPHLKKEYVKYLDKMKLVDYSPKNKQHLPDDKRPKYKVYETYETLEGKVDRKKIRMRYRQLFVCKRPGKPF